MANAPSQPTISGVRLVSRALITVPAVAMISGIMIRKNVFAFSVNWYGGAMLNQEPKHTSDIVIPKFDGFMKCRIRPATGACRACLPPTPMTTPKITGSSWLFP